MSSIDSLQAQTFWILIVLAVNTYPLKETLNSVHVSLRATVQVEVIHLNQFQRSLHNCDNPVQIMYIHQLFISCLLKEKIAMIIILYYIIFMVAISFLSRTV
jgi:hypothetical protein